MKVAIIVTFLLFVISSVKCQATELSSDHGVTNRKVENCTLQSQQYIFEVLPGMGWDNLRNLEMSRVLQLSYHQCKRSEDGRYLIADNIYLIPNKQSQVNLASEHYRKLTKYRSTEAHSINVEAGGNYHAFSASGSFSYESEYVRQQLYEIKGSLSKVQLRHNLYTSRIKANARLSPEFRNRLMDLASQIASNENEAYGDYLAQMIVRDFGTHVTKSVTAGAVLEKIDFLNRAYSSNSENKSQTIKSSASASFAKLVSLKISTTNSYSKQHLEEYEKNVMTSRVQTHGGPVFGANFTVKQWEKGLMNNLVAIDRTGDLMHRFITPRSLPEISEELVYKVGSLIEEKIMQYYIANSIEGCTDVNSKNFNPFANLDGKCEAVKQNFTIGGVYQTCQGDMPSLCNAFNKKNPLTGGYSCPEGYKSIVLTTGPGAKSYTQSCIRSWFKKKCKTHYHQSYISTHWCAPDARNSVPKGQLFGGVFTNKENNPLTDDKSCPPYFLALKLGHTWTVCLGYDLERSIANSVPFGGFFSCRSGNPLSLDKNIGRIQSTGEASKILLASNFQNELISDSQNAPKECPQGYSRHVAAIENDCQISYCVKMGVLKSVPPKLIKMPPYIALNDTDINWSKQENVKKLIGAGGKHLLLGSNGDWYESNHEKNDTSSNGWMIATVTMLVGLVTVGTITGLLIARKRRNRSSQYRSLPGVTFDEEVADSTPIINSDSADNFESRGLRVGSSTLINYGTGNATTVTVES